MRDSSPLPSDFLLAALRMEPVDVVGDIERRKIYDKLIEDMPCICGRDRDETSPESPPFMLIAAGISMTERSAPFVVLS